MWILAVVSAWAGRPLVHLDAVGVAEVDGSVVDLRVAACRALGDRLPTVPGTEPPTLAFDPVAPGWALDCAIVALRDAGFESVRLATDDHRHAGTIATACLSRSEGQPLPNAVGLYSALWQHTRPVDAPELLCPGDRDPRWSLRSRVVDGAWLVGAAGGYAWALVCPAMGDAADIREIPCWAGSLPTAARTAQVRAAVEPWVARCVTELRTSGLADEGVLVLDLLADEDGEVEEAEVHADDADLAACVQRSATAVHLGRARERETRVRLWWWLGVSAPPG